MKHLHPGACSGVGCPFCHGLVHNSSARIAWGVSNDAIATWLAANTWAVDPARKPPRILTKQTTPIFVEVGPGTKLKGLLASLGVNPSPSCDCNALAKQMDAWGPDGCEEHRTEIETKLRGHAKKYGWIDKITAAAHAVATGLVFKLNPFDPYPGLLSEAIRLASLPPPLNDESTKMQQDMDAAVAALIDVVPPKDLEGRGIVISAGGPVYFPAAWVCCYVLRKLGCKLPIEIWHIGQEEMDSKMAALLESLGNLRVRDAMLEPNRPRIHGGWQNKIFATMRSKFKEVLYLDADQIPTIDPAYLFEEMEYQDKGAVFWPDRRPEGCTIRELAFRIARLPTPAGRNLPIKRPDCPTDYIPFETGQFLVDKSKTHHWRTLTLALWMAERSDFWWSDGKDGRIPWIVYGDKDIFLLAWEKIRMEMEKTAPTQSFYAMPNNKPGYFGNDKTGGGLLQYDFQGNVIFQHRCQPPNIKWRMPPGINHDGGPRFQHFALCQEALNELQANWSGSIGKWEWFVRNHRQKYQKPR